MNWCDPKNQFKPNCAVKRQYRYLHIRSVYQTIPCSQSFISSQVVIMLKARRASYNLAFKLKIVAEAEVVESNSEMASVSPWSVAGVKIKPTFLTATLNCQRNGRRWHVSRRSIRSSIKEYWNGWQSREAKFFVKHWFCILNQQRNDQEVNHSAEVECVTRSIVVSCDKIV